MKVFRYPSKECLVEILERPEFDFTELAATVSAILGDLKQNGDEAVRRYTKKFDGCEIDSMAVTAEEISEAVDRIPDELKAAIDKLIQ